MLGHQRLIALLLPILQSTSRANPGNPTRLITLTSIAAARAPAGGIDYETVQKGGKYIDRWVEYGESKWGDIALAKYVDKHYGPKSGADGEILATAVHPGLVASNLYQHIWLVDTVLGRAPWLKHTWSVTSRIGSLNQIWTAELPAERARKLSGGYVTCYQTRGVERPDLKNDSAIEKLWAWCTAQAHRNE